MVERIVVPAAAQKMLLKKAETARTAMRELEDAQALVKAALGADGDGWRFMPDGSELFWVASDGEEESGLAEA